MARKGKWIVVEGIDGAGKTTLVKALIRFFHAQEKPMCVKHTSEPTTERYGHMFQIRMRQHLRGECEFPVTEQLQLLTRDRINHVARINQWLDDGAVVIQDRFWPSTVAYQGQSLDPMSLLNMHRWLFAPGPDLMIWLDTPMNVAMGRLSGRGDDDEFKSMMAGALDIYRNLHAMDFLMHVHGTDTTEKQVAIIIDHLMEKGWGRDD